MPAHKSITMNEASIDIFREQGHPLIYPCPFVYNFSISKMSFLLNEIFKFAAMSQQLNPMLLVDRMSLFLHVSEVFYKVLISHVSKQNIGLRPTYIHFLVADLAEIVFASILVFILMKYRTNMPLDVN